jgi:hypothetical protein
MAIHPTASRVLRAPTLHRTALPSSPITPATTPQSTPPPCAIDLDGDLLIENPARDRVADVPMVEMDHQAITIGITPEISGSITTHRASDFEATLELKEGLTSEMSGLLSIEGGFNLGLGLNLTSRHGGSESGTSSESTEGNALNIGAKTSQRMEYSRTSELQRRRVANHLAKIEQNKEVRLTPKAGYISIQFRVRNSGSQAVVLGDPSFAVNARVAAQDGTARLLTVAPEQAIMSAQIQDPSSGIFYDPIAMQQTLSITLGPGESRTISLRLNEQDTSMILELLKHSKATWASLHFGKQTAITDATITAAGVVTPGVERDISRDLVSRIRKRTIPFHFHPPRRGAGQFGRPRTTLLAAANGCVDTARGPEISLPELFAHHGNLATDWDNTRVTSDAVDQHRLFFPRIGRIPSTVFTREDIQGLSRLTPTQRSQQGRWELQVYHRDFGAVPATAMHSLRLTPEHQVLLRWVDGNTLLENADRRAGTVRRHATLHHLAGTAFPVMAGARVTLRPHSVRLDRALLGEKQVVVSRTIQRTKLLYQKALHGSTFPMSRLPTPIKQRMQMRYAIVSSSQVTKPISDASWQHVQWRNVPLRTDGSTTLTIPDDISVPSDAQLVLQPLPFEVLRKEGVFLQDRSGRESPFWTMGRYHRDRYAYDVMTDIIVAPPSKPTHDNRDVETRPVA